MVYPIPNIYELPMQTFCVRSIPLANAHPHDPPPTHAHDAPCRPRAFRPAAVRPAAVKAAAGKKEDDALQTMGDANPGFNMALAAMVAGSVFMTDAVSPEVRGHAVTPARRGEPSD